MNFELLHFNKNNQRCNPKNLSKSRENLILCIMKKSILIFILAIVGIIADGKAQVVPINLSTELSLDTPLGSDITAYPNSVAYPGYYELNLRVRAMIHSGHSGQFSFVCERRVFGTITWGTFTPGISQFPNSGITNFYSQSAKTYQNLGTIYEYRVKVTFVATTGQSTYKYTPIRKATIIGVPTACFSMYNVNSTANEPSLYGLMPVKTICQNAVTINGSCSQFENGYHVRISEFNLATWSFVGTDLYNGWVSGTGEAPAFISLNALAGAFTPGKLYIVSLSVGPVWNSAPPQFFRVVTCRNSGGDVDQVLEEVPSDFLLDEVAVASESLKLSPKPVKNDLTLTSADDEKILSYALFDNTGNEVVKKALTGDANTQTINLSDLRKGFYIINVESDKMMYKEKLIKE